MSDGHAADLLSFIGAPAHDGRAIPRRRLIGWWIVYISSSWVKTKPSPNHQTTVHDLESLLTITKHQPFSISHYHFVQSQVYSLPQLKTINLLSAFMKQRQPPSIIICLPSFQLLLIIMNQRRCFLRVGAHQLTSVQALWPWTSNIVIMLRTILLRII